MPAPPVYSKASGMDIQATINKLLELERIPGKRLQRDNQRNEVMIQAWEEVRNRSRKLANKSRDLYSFTGPFARRSIVSADPGAITGEASSRVELGRQEFQVLELASAHQVHTDPIGIEEELPAGKFTIQVDEKTHEFDFKGGKVKKLERQLQNRGMESFDLLRTRIDANRSLLTLRSKTSGKKGEIKFTDPDGLLRKIGLAKRPGENETFQDLVFGPGKISRMSRKEGEPFNGSYAVIDMGKGLRVDGQGTMLFTHKIPGDVELQFESQADYDQEKARRMAMAAEPDEKEEEETGERKKLKIGPDVKFKLGDQEIAVPRLERESALPVDEAPSPKDEDDKDAKKEQPNIPDRGEFAIGIRWRKDGKVQTKEIPWSAKGQQAERRVIDIAQITGGEPVEGLYFHAGQGASLTVQNLKIKRTGAEGGLVAAHETRPARDARLNVNGVEVTRSSNKGIDDLIEGAKINLHRATNGPTVVKVQINSDEIVQKIKDWVEAHNDLMKFCRENSKIDVKTQRETETAGKKDLSESMDKMRAASGVFATDSTIRQMIAGLRSVTAGSYPASNNPGYRVLDEIGVGTGAVGQNWKQIQYGYLELDEEKLRAALERSPEAVKELFASDTNEDNRVDNGVAFEMRSSLEPYNQLARGLIATRINLLKTQITDNKDRISKLEYSIENKEQSLRRRFGRMESAVQNSRSTSNFLRSKLGN